MATPIEHGLIAALCAVVVITGLTAIPPKLAKPPVAKLSVAPGIPIIWASPVFQTPPCLDASGCKITGNTGTSSGTTAASMIVTVEPSLDIVIQDGKKSETIINTHHPEIPIWCHMKDRKWPATLNNTPPLTDGVSFACRTADMP